VGITLGDIIIQAMWAIIGKVLDVPIYQFLS
jgi:L-alanine-DL-glutamate epimerase-like enolase superfamily enzyme